MPESLLQIRNSEVQSFKACRQQWWWAYVKRLKPNDVSAPLTIGTIVHHGLEHWYVPGKKRGTKPWIPALEMYDAFVEEFGRDLIVKDSDDPNKVLTARELIEAMLRGYVDEYGTDPWMEVVAPEMTFQVIYTDRSGKEFEFVGTIDGVIRDRRTKELGFLEHKTGAGLEPFGAPEPLDEQSGSYWAFAPEFLRSIGVLTKKEEPQWVLFNRLKKSMPDTRPTNAEGHALNKPLKEDLVAACERRGLEVKRGMTIPVISELLTGAGVDVAALGRVSERQPLPRYKRSWVHRSEDDRAILMDRVAATVQEMRLVRRKKLAVYKNPDRHCNWCPFGPTSSGMCEIHETGHDWESIRDAMFHEWNPYDAHEIELAERT
jgi:hypothetical protein